MFTNIIKELCGILLDSVSSSRLPEWPNDHLNLSDWFNC